MAIMSALKQLSDRVYPGIMISAKKPTSDEFELLALIHSYPPCTKVRVSASLTAAPYSNMLNKLMPCECPCPPYRKSPMPNSWNHTCSSSPTKDFPFGSK